MSDFSTKTPDVRGFSRETTSRTAHAKLRNSVRIRPTPTTAAQRCPVGARSRLGFTLIELLISIAIIATLSALFLGASRAAMESARAARTKTTILKIHTLIMEQYASYETRRVDLDQTVVDSINTAFAGNPQRIGNAMADLRVLATRELMKFEMPDRWSDIYLTRPPYATKQSGSRDEAAILLESVPTITRSYYRRYFKAYTNVGDEKVDRNQSAECLYLTVMLMTGDGEARTMFSAQDIGDADEDGLPEFLDGWGNPIQFLRWAPGFIAKSSIMSGDSDADHDPFDPFRRSKVLTPGEISNMIAWPPASSYGAPVNSYVSAMRGGNVPANGSVGFRLVPLIFSGGPDGSTDLSVQQTAISDPNGGAFDPYVSDDDGDRYGNGTPVIGFLDDKEDNFTDNITNHLQEGR